PGNLSSMTNQAKAGNIGHRVYAEAQGDFRASLIQFQHHFYRGAYVLRLGAALLEGRADQTGSQSFREEHSIARLGILILFDVLNFNHTCYRITELDLVIANRVTSEQRHSCFIELVEAAPHDVSEYRKI